MSGKKGFWVQKECHSLLAMSATREERKGGASSPSSATPRHDHRVSLLWTSAPEPLGDAGAALPEPGGGQGGAMPGPVPTSPDPVPSHTGHCLCTALSFHRLFRTGSLEHLLTPRYCGTAPRVLFWPCPLFPQALRTSPSTTYNGVRPGGGITRNTLGVGQLEVSPPTLSKPIPASTIQPSQALP